MAKLKPQIKIEYTVKMELTADEAAALVSLTGYGTQTFLKIFYEKLGKSYLQPYEKGLISLFETIKSELPEQLRFVKESRNIIDKSILEVIKKP